MTTINKMGSWMVFFSVFGAEITQAQSVLSQYDVIVSGELRNVSEFEGAGVIRTMTSGNNFNTATRVPNTVSQSSDTVYVQSALNRSISVQRGSLYYAGSQTVHQNANQFFVGGNIINIQGYNQGATIHQPGTFNFSAVFDGLTTESTTYGGYSPNSTASISGNNLIFKVGVISPVSGMAVFNIDKTLLETGNLSQINLDLSGKNPKSIIINVTGASGYTLNTPGGANFVGIFADKTISTKVLWNFGSAAEVNLRQSWYGSILAPSATLKDSSGALEGSVGVRNLDVSVEVHYPLWTGGGYTNQPPIPEPSASAACFAIGLLGFGVVRRFRGRDGNGMEKG